ncbi:Abi family protein [Bacillus velezensis]|uniref:Abi family protein n=1 Tax=Bacillus velezensis TaxID=492670 RepID=UPI000F8DB967|nr:Abi family protein [Bacillus velezensis]RUS03291.1 hypothetical protein EFW58_03739 [Bacillus velezensis]
MPADKEFNTLVNQIRLLKDRNLIIKNMKEAKKHLLEKNYFNLINGFETLLLDDHKKPPKNYSNMCFDDFLDLYEFDKKFSSLLFTKISELENKLKSSIAYHFCKNHCSTINDNNNYINLKNYSVPERTTAPDSIIKAFNKHILFLRNNYYKGRFKGSFVGKVTYEPKKTILEGKFSGRFASTSINEVLQGKCAFFNSRQSTLLKHIKSHAPRSGPITISLNINDERIYGLNYIDACKIKFNYINEYNNPPFWVIIKTLMFNDIITLLYGLKKRTLDAILRDFNLRPHDKEKFLNSLQIIRELRNSCAHFELVNRFRTSKRLKINAHLISQLGLKPMRSQFVIKLYDVLKVLKQYVNLDEIKSFLWRYRYHTKSNIAIPLFDRMGNANIYYWI